MIAPSCYHRFRAVNPARAAHRSFIRNASEKNTNGSRIISAKLTCFCRQRVLMIHQQHQPVGGETVQLKQLLIKRQHHRSGFHRTVGHRFGHLFRAQFENLQFHLRMAGRKRHDDPANQVEAITGGNPTFNVPVSGPDLSCNALFIH